MKQEIADLADRLGIKPATKAKWRIRGYVPHRWRLPMLSRASAAGIEIDESDFEWRREGEAA